MRTIHVHGLAESDLIDIWRYSFEQWGELQADKYLDELDSAIRKLADNPETGVKRDYVREGYRVLFFGSHAVYYKALPGCCAYNPSLAWKHGSGEIPGIDKSSQRFAPYDSRSSGMGTSAIDP